MSSAVQEQGAGRTADQALGFSGHLRVRKASAGEKPGLAGFFACSGHAEWVKETLAAARARILVVERFSEGAWLPLGYAVTDAGGEIALALQPDERGRGLAHEALRAAVRELREEPFAELTACLGPEDAGFFRIFGKAGFTPAGECLFRGRPSTRYVLNLRGDCTPYNVWI